METKISIDSIIINIGKKELKLSKDEAKQLQQCLNDFLGNSFTSYFPITIQESPKWPYQSPIWSSGGTALLGNADSYKDIKVFNG